MIETTKALDPTTVPVSDDVDKKAVTDYVALAPKYPGINSVMTASSNLTGVSWYFGSTAIPLSLAEAARVSLEICEFAAKAPCVILSTNGHDARDQDGAWPAQPEMLVKAPGSELSAWTLPFTTQFNRGLAAGLAALPNPSVVVLSLGGGWSSGTGKTILEAIDTAFASCAKSNPNYACVLYSVDGTVVMTQ